jgi:hypothetical protein
MYIQVDSYYEIIVFPNGHQGNNCQINFNFKLGIGESSMHHIPKWPKGGFCLQVIILFNFSLSSIKQKYCTLDFRQQSINLKPSFFAIHCHIHSGQILHTKILSSNFYLFLYHSNKILPPNTEINDVKKIFFLIIQILKVIFIQHSNKEDQLSIIQIRMYNRVTLRLLPLVFCS